MWPALAGWAAMAAGALAALAAIDPRTLRPVLATGALIVTAAALVAALFH